MLIRRENSKTENAHAEHASSIFVTVFMCMYTNLLESISAKTETGHAELQL